MTNNYQMKKDGDLQDLYEQASTEASEAYEKRKIVLEKLWKARKAGNFSKVPQLEELAEKYSKQYENGKLKMFTINNNKEELRDH